MVYKPIISLKNNNVEDIKYISLEDCKPYIEQDIFYIKKCKGFSQNLIYKLDKWSLNKIYNLFVNMNLLTDI
jgi:hypothetical protein